MARSRIGSVVVTNKGEPVGIVTEGDVSRAVAVGVNTKSATLKSLIKRKLITTTSDVRLEEAAGLMSTADVKKLPVVEGGQLIGIVTQTDIVSSSFELVNTLKELVRARYKPPDFEP
jgi:CBS domain-containing protein